MRWYRVISLIFVFTFIAVGLLFLFYADGVLAFFNIISDILGFSPSPTEGVDFFLILTGGYMYMVTLIAYMMYRHPTSAIYPLLLTHGKWASSFLSLCFFIFHRPYLIYLANFFVDGLIGVIALIFYSRLKKTNP